LTLAWVSSVPFRVWRPHHAWGGFEGFAVLIYGMLFFIGISILSALTGATAISSERERGTWESLLLTSLGVRAIVRAKLLSRVALLAGLVALTLPFWLTWANEVLEVNNTGPFNRGLAHSAPYRLAVRMSLFLVWLAVRIVGHVLPFAALGLAVSARCCYTKTALIVTGVLACGLCALTWFLRFNMQLFTPPLFTDYLIMIAFWPLMPNDFTYYTMTGPVSTHWQMDIIADTVWLSLIPYLLFRLAVRWSRRPDRVPNWFERRAHGL
jgi:ABC-type Na+ efflux pump permease subunit